MRHAILPVLAAGVLLAGCGGADTDAAVGAAAGGASTAKAAATTSAIKIVDFVYRPTPATVRAGQKIAIANADDAPHTITDSGAGKVFDSGTVQGKATGSVTIARPGTYSYICEFHPFMKGAITVTK
jgi:plastocyanin